MPHPASFQAFGIEDALGPSFWMQQLGLVGLGTPAAMAYRQPHMADRGSRSGPGRLLTTCPL
jgi:hypothetical protein